MDVHFLYGNSPHKNIYMYFLKEVLIHKVYDHGFHVEVCRRIPLVFLFDIILLWSRSKAFCTFH